MGSIPRDEYVGSIDQGTTSTRFLIFNTAGEPVASHQMGFKNIHPNSGYVLGVLESCRGGADPADRADGTNTTRMSCCRASRRA